MISSGPLTNIHFTDKTWVFPDDQREQSSYAKILASAHRWRQATAQKTSGVVDDKPVAAPAVEETAAAMAVDDGENEEESSGEE
jgi:hypothetical protein